MMEGTDARVHYICYTPEAARNSGCLQINSFIRLRKLLTEGRPVLEINEMGDAESILHNQLYPRETARRLIRSGVIPQDDGWSGWLGHYQKALAKAAITIKRQRLTKEVQRHERRGFDR
jgi:hypothetical protein